MNTPIMELEDNFKREPMNPGHEIKVLDKGFVRYVDHMGSDADIVAAARVSYGATSKGADADMKLLHYLYKNRHTSPFEMVKVVFNIKMPIFVMRQFVRHRMQNLNEVSARYTELPDEFYIPAEWRKQDKVNKQGSIKSEPLELANSYAITDCDSSFFHSREPSMALEQHCRDCYGLYQDMIQSGIAKEMARFVLPVNIYTEIRCCWDLKNLLGFFALRDDPHAQWEHQQYGKAMKEIAKILFPQSLAAYEKFKFPCVEIL